ncbi:MAG: 30S ribosomal protein S8 [Desulfobulbales bacterium]|nr:30S ribosomal protein S8 [Desulfobulbales bacterium]
MSMSDPLADMLTRIRNAGMVRYETVDVPMSNLKIGVAKVLRDEGYIKDYEIIEDNKQGTLRVELKYGPQDELVINGLRRVSKPGLRKYVKADDIPKVLSGLGISILSTSKGIMTDREARRLRVGGEILCEAW